METNIKRELSVGSSLSAILPLVGQTTVAELKGNRTGGISKKTDSIETDFADRLAKVLGQEEQKDFLAEKTQNPKTAQQDSVAAFGLGLLTGTIPSVSVDTLKELAGLSENAENSIHSNGWQAAKPVFPFLTTNSQDISSSLPSLAMMKTGPAEPELFAGEKLQLIVPEKVMPIFLKPDTLLNGRDEWASIKQSFPPESLTNVEPVATKMETEITQPPVAPQFKPTEGENTPRVSASALELSASEISQVKTQPHSEPDFRVLRYQNHYSGLIQDPKINTLQKPENDASPALIREQQQLPGILVEPDIKLKEPTSETTNRFVVSNLFDQAPSLSLAETDSKGLFHESLELKRPHVIISKEGEKEHSTVSAIPFDSNKTVSAEPTAFSQPLERPRTDLHDVIKQIADSMVSPAQAHKSSQVVVALKPQHLGEVTIRVQVDGDKVTASFHAASSEVRAILESSLPQLRQEMSQQGWQFDSQGVFGGMQQFLANQEQRQPEWQNYVFAPRVGAEEYEDGLAFNQNGRLQIISASAVDYRV